MRKRAMSIIVILVLGFIAIALLLRWREPGMIFYPTREIIVTPATMGFAFEDVYLKTSDGMKINGWSLPVDNAPVTVLFFHGNAGNISHRFEKLNVLRRLGASVFIVDYHGYGRSEGVPSERATYLDASAAYDYLTRQRGIPAKIIVLYGESLGSAVAVDLASKAQVGGVIVEEGFTSVGDVGQRMFPFLPVRWLVQNKYDTLSKIGRINAPLLLLHSAEDEFFEMRHAERLFAAAREPKQFVKLRGTHNEAFVTSEKIYRAALEEFLKRCINL
jgi:fermentation-respiration switch protein FrsA (DUF1100 family)